MDKLSAIKAVFPDFDIDEALKRLANNAGLYEKLLTKFAASYGGAAGEMQGFIDAGSIQDAERSAHTFKGLAGTIGATKFSETCRTLEYACKSGDKAEIDAAFTAFALGMNELLAQLNAGLEKLKSMA